MRGGKYGNTPKISHRKPTPPARIVPITNKGFFKFQLNVPEGPMAPKVIMVRPAPIGIAARIVQPQERARQPRLSCEVGGGSLSSIADHHHLLGIYPPPLKRSRQRWDAF